MAECDWIILCDYAFLAARNKVSLIGIFDTIYARELPIRHDRPHVAMSIVGEPGESVQAKLEIIGPSGQVVAGGRLEAVLPDSGSAQMSLQLPVLELSEWGRHAIQIDLGYQQVKSAWFTVTRIQQAPR